MVFPRFSFAYFENMDVRIFGVLAFLVPLMARGIPEILMGKHIAGFDTISYYVPVTLRLVNGGTSFLEFTAYAPLFYALLTALTLTGVPLNVSLKLLPTALHGLLGLAIYLYARKALEWSYKKSLFVSCLATLYFVALRISWDMLRSELGLIFLFVFLIFLRHNWKEKSWKGYPLLSLSMVLIVLTHQLVAIVMFAIIFAFALQKLFNKERVGSRKLLLSTIPAMVLFLLTVFAEFTLSTSFSIINGFDSAKSEGWLSLFGFASYFDMFTYNLGFLFYCCLPLSPFILAGIKHLRSLELKIAFFWCLLMPFSSIFSPCAYRWTLMLVFPAAFFAVEGFGRFGSRLWKKSVGVFLILLSVSFVLLPAEVAFPYFWVFPSYVPSSMLQNSVPLRDCGDVVRALSWVVINIGSNGVLLVHDAFHGWALLYLNDSDRVVCYGYENPEEVALEKFENGYSRLFLVWWVAGEGWHGWASLPSCFVEVFRSNRIAVYTYNESNAV